MVLLPFILIVSSAMCLERALSRSHVFFSLQVVRKLYKTFSDVSVGFTGCAIPSVSSKDLNCLVCAGERGKLGCAVRHKQREKRLERLRGGEEGRRTCACVFAWVCWLDGWEIFGKRSQGSGHSFISLLPSH